MTLRRPSAATLIALLALFVALGGPARAASAISGSSIRSNSITGKQVKAKSLSITDLTAASLTSLHRIGSHSVTGLQLKDGAVGRASLAPDAVDGSKLLDFSVGALDLAPGSVFGDKLAAGAVGGTAIVTDGIGSRALADSSVGSGELVDGAVGPAEIPSGQLGASDVGRFGGTLSDLDFGTLEHGACTSVDSPSLVPYSGLQDLTDDAIVVTPSPTFPGGGLSVSAQASSPSQIRVTVCNVGSTAPVGLGTQSFRYVTFDAGS